MRYVPAADATGNPVQTPPEMKNVILPLVHRGGGVLAPVDDRTMVKNDDVVRWMIFGEREEDAMTFLQGMGWIVCV